MADLYGTSANGDSSTHESEEMPWFLENLLPNSTTKPSPYNFSDPGGFFPAEANESIRNSFSSSCAEDCDAITPTKRRKFPEDVEDFDFGSEVPFSFIIGSF